MKKSQLLVLAVLTLFFTNCSNDDDNSGQANELQGEWRLVSVTSPMVNETHTYAGIIKWNFEEDNQTVTVTSSSADDLNPLENGTYDYTVAPEAEAQVCEEFLIIEAFEAGCIEFSNNQLTLSTSFIDGPIYTLAR